MSIATQFSIGEMFLVDPADMLPEDTFYLLKGVVCFVGAHYFTFIRHQSEVQKPEWLLFDDDKPIQAFSSWEAVLNNILQFGNLPTLLLYEKSK